MKTCGCLPGTEENGWHEVRSEACLAEESAAFARALERFRDWYLRKPGDTP